MSGRASVKQEILEQLESIQTVDCHSHTGSEATYKESPPQHLFHLLGYFKREVSYITGLPYRGELPEGTDRKAALRQALAVDAQWLVLAVLSGETTSELEGESPSSDGGDDEAGVVCMGL